MAKKSVYKRILLKISGEALLGKENTAFDPQAVTELCHQISSIQSLGVQVGVVIGGGNILRGTQANALELPRDATDLMGMLGTVINGMMLSERLKSMGCPAFVASSFTCGSFVPAVIGNDTVDLLEEKVVVIFVGGTGFPYLTTDTAAALRACEIQAEALIKATKVDGVFDQDPKKNGKAQLMTQMTYNEVLRQNLHVMDAAAVALCRDQNIPIHVINIFKKGALQNVIEGRKEGSVVRG